MREAALKPELGLKDLVLFNIAAVVGIRWLAAAGHTGPGSISLWILAAALFFVPSALAVAALSARYPEEGGLYVWTKRSFGDWHGFLCGWCYWLSNLFYVPNLLLAGVGIAAYAFGPEYAKLADDRAFVVPISVVLLWVALLTNLVGLRIGKWTENLGGFATYLAGGLLIVLGAMVWANHGAATRMSIAPQWNWDRINFWSQIAFAFGGLELGAVLGGEVRDARRTVPRAAWISGIAIAGFYIAGTVAMLALLPPDRINPITGLAQAGAQAGARLGIAWLSPLMALLITLGVTGQLGAWLGGCARIPYVVGVDRYLPPALARLHPRWGTPYVSLLWQGAACTVFLVAMQLGENLRTGYQLLVDMTVITYFIPFLYLFLTAWRNGRHISAPLGLAVTLAAIAFSLVPPDGTASVWLFEVKLAGGSALLVLSGRMCFNRGRRYQRNAR